MINNKNILCFEHDNYLEVLIKGNSKDVVYSYKFKKTCFIFDINKCKELAILMFESNLYLSDFKIFNYYAS